MTRHSAPLRVALTLIALLTALGREGAATDRVFRLYGQQDGLPTDEVADVAQDALGFLWIATPGGLVRFDGDEMRPWDTAGRRITRLAAAAGFGLLAIDDAGRLLRVSPIGGLEDLPGPDGSPLDAVVDVTLDGSGSLWILRANELLHTRTLETWARLPQARFRSERLRSVRNDGEAGVFVLTDEAIWVADTAGQVRRAIDMAFAVDVLRESDGDVLVLTTGVFVAKSHGAIEPLLEIRTARPIDLIAREGSIWVSFDRFVARLTPGAAPAFIGPEHGLPGGGRLFVDREGSLWIGTFRGLLQFPEADSVIWSEHDGLPSTHARFLGRNEEGIWISTWGGLARLDDGGSQPHAVSGGARHFGDICIDRDGGLWYGGDNLYEHAGGVTAIHTWPNALVRFCAPASDGSIWLGVGGRLARASRGEIQEIFVPHTSGSSVSFPAPLLEDEAGWLWMGYPSRICRAPVARIHARGAWTCEALPTGVEPTSMIETRGTLWLGTHSHGVLRRDDEGWQPISASHELGGGRVFKLRPRGDGSVWVLGLGRPTRVVDRPDTAAGWEVVEVLSSWHGFPSGGTSDLLEERDGTIWAAGAAGLVRIPAHARGGLPPPPPVQLSGMAVDGRGVSPDAQLGLTHRRNLLELRFAALTYRDRALLRYQARIGARNYWRALTAGDPVLRFPELPSGSYVAEFRASVDGRTWSEDPARVAFQVADPWYLRPWFFALAATAAGGMLLAAHRARLRLALRLERQRTQIAMDLHDEIGSGLGSIGILAGIAGNRTSGAPVRSLLAEISDTAAELSTSLGDIVWSMRPGSRTLQELFERIAERGHRLFPNEAPAFICAIPDTREPVVLGLTVQRNVLLIVAEALHNAAVHAGARHVRVLMSAEGSGWRVQVRDDGRGFDQAAVDSAKVGLGLSSMGRRAAEIGAALEIASRPGAGTTVALLFHPEGGTRERRPARA